MRYEGVSGFTDKCGRQRWRFRKRGLPTVMLHAEFGSDEFQRQYELAKSGLGHEIPKSTPSERGDDPSRRRELVEGWVYFICADRGPIKIGFSQDPEARLKDFKVAQARKMRVAAKFRGTMDTERQVQKLWWSLRIRGEWFRRSDDLMKFIKHVADGKPLPTVCQIGAKNG